MFLINILNSEDGEQATSCVTDSPGSTHLCKPIQNLSKSEDSLEDLQDKTLRVLTYQNCRHDILFRDFVVGGRESETSIAQHPNEEEVDTLYLQNFRMIRADNCDLDVIVTTLPYVEYPALVKIETNNICVRFGKFLKNLFTCKICKLP
ncbi:uncharacterized protein LOC116170741 [Photinus pyralis]|uniref:uncharacterized protein LOC116170391 n=1 Tax=Photinus pyralis TaxID=7054 RepID=UPI0012675041|nr:uncharacterized protein LOC116170391 [Photinus pyralis]XP_031343107.1 uncharacterized protein LOC116170741 [Photinus pyralis]